MLESLDACYLWNMSIEASHISKLYGEQKALDNVSFSIGSGEVVGFLGPNGAGKSTMMKIITCFLPPSQGEVKVCGYDVIEEAMEVKKRVGYLPEHNPLYLDMYVKEYLHFMGGIHKLDKLKQRVDDMVHLVGLEVESHKQIGALSKGYRQRVGLAQALLHDPDVLILDEPTSGLDPNQLVEIRELIKRIGQEKTVMLSTHIMQEVEALCNRVIIINRGHIVADKASSELGSLSEGNTLVLHVEFGQTLTPDLIMTIPGVSSVKSINEKEFEISSDSSEDIRPAIFRFAVDQGTEVLTMNKRSASMEDIFKQLTREKS